jgi:hypothetical protein
MKFLIAVLVALVALALVAPARAATLSCQGQTVTTAADGHGVCTKNFYFSGTCTGADQNPNLSDSAGINTPLVNGWEVQSIAIHDIWIVFIPPRPTSFYAFAGNSYTPDIMSWITSEGVERHSSGGESWGFPPYTAGQHIDLHISCSPVGFAFQGFYTVVYQPI